MLLYDADANDEQHGSPIWIVDMGGTAIDEDTFNDYLAAMREQYIAVEVRVCPADSTALVDWPTILAVPPAR